MAARWMGSLIHITLNHQGEETMDQEGRITTERQGHVLLIGLDRVSKRNAFDKAMLNALGKAYAELEHDQELRCGVLLRMENTSREDWN